MSYLHICWIAQDHHFHPTKSICLSRFHKISTKMSERTILKNFPFEFLRNIASGTFDIFDGKLKELNSVDVIVWNPSLQYFTLFSKGFRNILLTLINDVERGICQALACNQTPSYWKHRTMKPASYFRQVESLDEFSNSVTHWNLENKIWFG